MRIEYNELRRRRELSVEEARSEVAALIAACATDRNKSLSLDGYQIFGSLEAIANFDWLEALSFSGTPIRDLSPLLRLKALTEIDCSLTEVIDLSPLSGLSALTKLDCPSTEVIDLSPLSGLSALNQLDCSSTGVIDLGPLSGLSSLTKLDCSSTGVTDLSPLSGLSALTKLDCSSTGVTDLSPLSGLSALTKLDCSSTGVIDLSPLSGLNALTDLNFSDTPVGDLSPLSGLSALTDLGFSDTPVSDLGALSGLSALTDLNFSDTPVSDLSPLSGLGALTSLYFSETDVDDLSPLSKLSRLTDLYFFGTRVRDLSALAGLSALNIIYFFETPVSDLAPLSGLSELKTLYFSGTDVFDLSPISQLTKMNNLYFSETLVNDLDPISGLSSLIELDCSATLVRDLGPLSGLGALTDLNCSGTLATDLGPLSGLSALTDIDCDGMLITDLTPLLEIDTLASLDCSHTTIATWPRNFFELPCFDTLTAVNARIDRIPGEELSEDYLDNCLPNIRAYFADLDAGAAPLERSKVIVLGNGQVGKTQLRRWLLNSDATPLPYDPAIPSTHGIEVLRGPLALPSGGEPLDVSIWDFGGQDIYHGTHSLFMKTRAIFVLCWTPEQEDNREQWLDGLIHQNRPMAYWVDYVRQLAGPDNPLIIVQTQCDTPGDKQPNRFADLDLKDFESHHFIHFSANKGHGGAALREAIGEAADWIKDRHGVPLIGTGRLKILDQLEAWRSEDALREPAARQHKMMAQEKFQTLCDAAGGISSPPHLLNFLHHAGVIFYRPGLFDDRIILDQDWALNAIYAVFNRDNCYRWIKRAQGRFRRADIAETAWRDYGLDEQRLFLSMMESCGIVFTHYRYDDDGDAEYIAPELLPPREHLAAQIESRWHGGEIVEAKLRYGLLHHGLIRQIVARIGDHARIFGEYWQTGVLFYERHRQSVAMIEAVADADGWGGEIVISCRNGRAAELVDLLVEEVDKIGQSIGMTAEDKPDPMRPAPEHRDEEKPEPAPLSAGAHPSAAGKWYVSYAWGDDTPEGRQREARVNALCDAAKARGIEIVRDRDTIRNGDSIRGFMEALVEGDRIIAILSDKYLRSPYCMYELFHAWRKQQSDRELFARAVRAYRLPCAKFAKHAERGAVGKYWRETVEEIKPVLDSLGERDSAEYQLMRKFEVDVGDILYAINDTVTPREWDAFLDWAFGD